MTRVEIVQPLEAYLLFVRFDDGVEGTIDIEDRLFGAIFEPLRDWDLFRQVTVDEFGVVCWPNGADLAPDALHARLRDTPAVATR
jgi:hypothetical protein